MLSTNSNTKHMVVAGIDGKVNRLESIVEQIGEAVLATTETIERLAERVDNLSIQVEEQGKQVQQQGYQILALCDAVQTVTENLDRLMRLLEGSN